MKKYVKIVKIDYFDSFSGNTQVQVIKALTSTLAKQQTLIALENLELACQGNCVQLISYCRVNLYFIVYSLSISIL